MLKGLFHKDMQRVNQDLSGFYNSIIYLNYRNVDGNQNVLLCVANSRLLISENSWPKPKPKPKPNKMKHWAEGQIPNMVFRIFSS